MGYCSNKRPAPVLERTKRSSQIIQCNHLQIRMCLFLWQRQMAHVNCELLLDMQRLSTPNILFFRWGSQNLHIDLYCFISCWFTCRRSTLNMLISIEKKHIFSFSIADTDNYSRQNYKLNLLLNVDFKQCTSLKQL